MIKRYQLIVFDWDGTLMDSAPRIVAAMQDAANEVGLPIPDAHSVKNLIGLSLNEVFDSLFTRLTPTQHQQLFEAYRYQYVDGAQPATPLFDQVEETLRGLKDKGYRLSVATGKARRGLKRVFAETNIGDLFDDSICADEAKGKPHPEMLQLLSARQNTAVDDCIMIGDTSYDLQMAASAGMHSVGVSYGAHSVEQLKAHGPQHILDELSELLTWLD